MSNRPAVTGNNEQLQGELEWLVSESGKNHIFETYSQLSNGRPLHSIVKMLRQCLTPGQTHWVMEVAESRIRGRRKFDLAHQMLFTRAGLEMATDQSIAKLKADRFKHHAHVADICCGIGGDLIGLAMRNPTCQTSGFDLDKTAVEFANHNLREHGLPRCAAIGDYNLLDIDAFDAIHVDPERRKFGRSTHGEKFSPSIHELFHVNSNRSMAIKLAPATNHSILNNEDFERQWIGNSRECKQQVVWTGELANRNYHVATVIKDGKFVEYGTHRSLLNTNAAIAEKIQGFIFEPHNTVIAARLTDAMSNEFELKRLGQKNAYLTANHLNDHPLLSCFEVLDRMPADTKKFFAAICAHDFGEIEFKNRGVTETFADRFKKIRNPSGTRSGTVILTVFKNQHVAILCSRRSPGKDDSSSSSN